jgi:hypothetical protein
MKQSGGIYPGKRRKSYYRRILAFCETERIEIPDEFHSRNAFNYVLIDVSSGQACLVGETWYLESWVVDFLKSRTAQARSFRILDFDKCQELKYEGGKKLSRMGAFNCHKEADIVY